MRVLVRLCHRPRRNGRSNYRVKAECPGSRTRGRRQSAEDANFKAFRVADGDSSCTRGNDCSRAEGQRSQTGASICAVVRVLRSRHPPEGIDRAIGRDPNEPGGGADHPWFELPSSIALSKQEQHTPVVEEPMGHHLVSRSGEMSGRHSQRADVAGARIEDQTDGRERTPRDERIPEENDELAWRPRELTRTLTLSSRPRERLARRREVSEVIPLRDHNPSVAQSRRVEDAIEHQGGIAFGGPDLKYRFSRESPACPRPPQWCRVLHHGDAGAVTPGDRCRLRRERCRK
jgi:hypothetical protein